MPSSEHESSPILEIDGDRATVRLNRPSVANRIEPGDLVTLCEHFERIDTDETIRVVVVTGTGSIFSSGYHLGDLRRRTSEEHRGSRATGFEETVDKLERIGAPTICRLNGGVYGGATDLALCCDFRIGDSGVRMAMPAARLGLHYYESGLARYVTRLGVDATKALFLTARRIGAAEMHRIGYLTDLCEPGGLDAAVDALAREVASLAPLSVRGMKRSINEIARQALERQELTERVRRCARSEDLQEGLRAFEEKRPPRFTGR